MLRNIYIADTYNNRIQVLTLHNTVPPQDSACVPSSRDRIITGTYGGDTLLGDSGSHVISGLGDDKINGYNGSDVTSGGNEDDCLAGSSGNDLVQGDAGKDQIFGHNALVGCLGAGHFDCGPGNERIKDVQTAVDTKTADCQ